MAEGNAMSISNGESRLLLGFAAFGFLVVNGLFAWGSVSAEPHYAEIFANPIALAFVLEAFGMLALLMWLAPHLGISKPGRSGLLVLALAGSLLFAFPLVLYLNHRRRVRARHTSIPDEGEG